MGKVYVARDLGELGGKSTHQRADGGPLRAEHAAVRVSRTGERGAGDILDAAGAKNGVGGIFQRLDKHSERRPCSGCGRWTFVA